MPRTRVSGPWTPVMSFTITSIFLFLIMLMRYFSVSGVFYWLVWKRPLRWRERELNSDKPSRSAITREILWSISATLIFAVPGAFMLEGWELGWTRIYLEPTRYGWAYFVLSPLLYMALHHTYFRSDFCCAWRVHARGLGARVDADLPRTYSLRLVLFRAEPAALHGSSRHIFLLGASAASSAVVVSPCALRSSRIAAPVPVGVVFFSSPGVRN